LKKILEANDCFVLRSAGSKSIDLVSVFIGPEVVFVEEKSTHSDKLYITNSGNKEQFDMNRQLSEKYDLTIVYAVRFIDNSKKKLWKVYEPDYKEDGYPVFRNDEGVPLDEWIDSITL